MAYPALSTFVIFPNGETQDVAGCGWTVVGNEFILTRAGNTVYSYKFANPSDVRAFMLMVAKAMLAYNTNPVTMYEWSTDAETWEPGAVPVNAMPCYLQIFGAGLSGATSCTLTDSNGILFNLNVFIVSSTAIVVGPFNQPGTNTPAIGNSTLFVFNAGNSIIGSVVIPFGPPQALSWTPQTPGTLAQWFKADAITGIVDGGTVSTWPASFGSNGTATGSPIFKVSGQNGLPIVRFNELTDQIQTSAFGSPLSQPLTIAIAYRDNSSGHNEIFFNGISNTVSVGVNNGSLYINAGSLALIGSFDTSFHFLFIVLNGSSTTFSFDGAPLQTVSSTPGSNTLDGVTVGFNIGNAALVDIGEAIVWSGDGTAYFLDAAQYLMKRWA